MKLLREVGVSHVGGNLLLLKKLVQESLLLGVLKVGISNTCTERELGLELRILGGLTFHLICVQNESLDLLGGQSGVKLLVNSSLVSDLKLSLSLILLHDNVFSSDSSGIDCVVNPCERIYFLRIEYSISILLLFFCSLSLLSPDGICNFSLLLLFVGCHVLVYILLELSGRFCGQFVKLELKSGGSILRSNTFGLMFLLLK